MDELSRGPKALIAAAMAEDDPPPIVAESGWSAMSERLSQRAAVSERPTRMPGARRAARRVPWLVVPAALALAAAIAWSFGRAPDQPERAPAPRHPSAVARAEHAPTAPVVDVRDVESRDDTGPDEAALIAEAEAALASGDGERALEVLDRHALRFPMGARADDRLTVRIRSLCALGRTAEAKAEVDGVRRVRPDAPALRRLRVANPCTSQ